jgi:hypothetical protein
VGVRVQTWDEYARSNHLDRDERGHY